MQSRYLNRTGRKLMPIAGLFVFSIFCLNLFAATTIELVKNGDFSSTVTTNWPLQRKDSATVTGAITGGQYVITRSAAASAGDTNPWFIQFYQKGLRIEKGMTYAVSFSAKADTTFTVSMNIGNIPGAATPVTYSGYKTYSITKILDTFSFDFKMDSTTDTNSRIVFDLGSMRIKGTITMDNISVKAVIDTGANNKPANEILLNGNFSSTNLTGSNWKLACEQKSTGSMKVENGQLKISITKQGTEQASWEVQLQQVNCKIEKGCTYHVSFHGKADSNFQIMAYVGMNKDPWSSYTGWANTFSLAPDMDTSYNFDFSMDTATDSTAKFVIGLGLSPVPNTVILDNISIKKTGTGVKNAFSFSRSCSPSPALLKNGRIQIGPKQFSAPASIRLFDSFGKLVFSLHEIAPVKGGIPLGRKLSKGVYFMEIVESNAHHTPASTMIRLMQQ
jgi:hypothetical protein